MFLKDRMRNCQRDTIYQDTLEHNTLPFVLWLDLSYVPTKEGRGVDGIVSPQIPFSLCFFAFLIGCFLLREETDLDGYGPGPNG